MSKKNKKKIYILLTRFNDTGAKMLSKITDFYYTHASIGIEGDCETFYSFVYKGFRIEKIERYIKSGKAPIPCRLYELEVSERVYNSVQRLIRSFINRKESMKYTRLGVAMCLLKIPYQRSRHFFCSQFVADILKKSKAAKLEKASTLFLPRDFLDIPGIKLLFRGNLTGLRKRFSALPSAI